MVGRGQVAVEAIPIVELRVATVSLRRLLQAGLRWGIGGGIEDYIVARGHTGKEALWTRSGTNGWSGTGRR